MSAMQRNKGANGERELARLLRDLLGDAVITRNLIQSREGGADLILDGYDWALEVKRAATAEIRTWWSQAVLQAMRAGKKPALAYRLDRQQWRFRVLMRDVIPGTEFQGDNIVWTMETGIEAFAMILRESLPVHQQTETP